MKIGVSIALAFAAIAGAQSSSLEDFYQPLTEDTGRARRISYRVRENETLFSIAQRFFGDPYKAEMLARVNHIDDPLTLEAGRSIEIPIPALGILYSLQRNDGCDLVEINERATFRPGDRFQLRLTTNIDGYVYVFNRQPSGDIVRLTPDAKGIRVKAFAEHVLPRGEWFRFDSERGQEELIVLVSPSRLTEMDSDMAAQNARERVRRLLEENPGRVAPGEGKDGIGRAMVMATPVGNNLVLAHRIVLKKQ